MAKVILNIGHGGLTHDSGAVHYGVKENSWNEDFICNVLAPKLDNAGIKYEIVRQSLYKFLPSKINKLTDKGDFIISFHLNSSDSPQSTGTEYLYYYKSEKSKELAELMHKIICPVLGLRDRNPLPRERKDRGGFLLYNTDAPCVIAEPAFLSNKNDLDTINEKKQYLADAYVGAIKEYFSRLK